MFADSSRVYAQRVRRHIFLHVSAQYRVRHSLAKTVFSKSPLSYEYFPWAERHSFLSSVDAVYNSVRVLFLIVLAFSLMSVIRMRSDHALSKIILLTIFALRLVPSILMSIKFGTVSDSAGPSIVQIVGDGLYLAILTSDLIIAKIASRQVHVLLPVIALASVISHHVSIVAAFVYHITVIYDLCTHLQVSHTSKFFRPQPNCLRAATHPPPTAPSACARASCLLRRRVRPAACRPHGAVP
jgi:hypothetical protein